MRGWRLIVIGCLLNAVVSGDGWTSQSEPPDAEVALAPFAVSTAQASDLRAVADGCLERLAAALAAKGVKVVRRASLDGKTLERAKPARWAVLGKFEREKDSIRAELRLMEVSTGDEMRSYFHSSSDPKDMMALGTRVGERIVLFVQEKRAGR